MWLKEFKLALITQDIKKIDKLIDTIPQFKNEKEMQEAFFYIMQAKELLESLKDKTALELQKIKKNIEFINSSLSQKNNTLDIIS